MQAEGFGDCAPGCNRALHTHPLFHDLDVYGQGRPTILANASPEADPRPDAAALPVSAEIQKSVFKIPWFKRFDPQAIKQYARAFRKAAEGYEELLPGDTGNPDGMGNWGTSSLERP